MSTRSPHARTPRALDRILTLPLLDDVYRVAAMDKSALERSELLTIALREHTSDADADNKMKKTVTRIWVNPPAPAAPMIRWALQHPEEFPDHRVMHAGAVLATVPYIGSVITQLGRLLALREAPTVVELRRRMVSQWGDSSTVQAGVGKTITSLRRLDIVTGGGREPIRPTTKLAATAIGSSWLIHAAMLAREVQSIDVHEALGLPELFWACVLHATADYPFLELHREGPNRRVWSIR
jgi:hypothetical protein